MEPEKKKNIPEWVTDRRKFRIIVLIILCLACSSVTSSGFYKLLNITNPVDAMENRIKTTLGLDNDGEDFQKSFEELLQSISGGTYLADKGFSVIVDGFAGMMDEETLKTLCDYEGETAMWYIWSFTYGYDEYQALIAKDSENSFVLTQLACAGCTPREGMDTYLGGWNGVYQSIDGSTVIEDRVYVTFDEIGDKSIKFSLVFDGETQLDGIELTPDEYGLFEFEAKTTSGDKVRGSMLVETQEYIFIYITESNSESVPVGYYGFY